MAGTSILATICAERLTKFLTRYSKVQVSNRCSQLRSPESLESVEANMLMAPNRGTSKTKIMDSIYGFHLGSRIQLQSGKSLGTRRLSGFWKKSLRKRPNIDLSGGPTLTAQQISLPEKAGKDDGHQDTNQDSSLATVLAKYAEISQHRSRDYLDKFDKSQHYLI